MSFRVIAEFNDGDWIDQIIEAPNSYEAKWKVIHEIIKQHGNIHIRLFISEFIL